jgi:hypothetical protein
LADYSFFHSPEELANMLTELGTSLQWAAIKEAVDELYLGKIILRSRIEKSNLGEKILQIAIDNRLVSEIVFKL